MRVITREGEREKDMRFLYKEESRAKTQHQAGKDGQSWDVSIHRGVLSGQLLVVNMEVGKMK